jgi:hypothetical protein
LFGDDVHVGLRLRARDAGFQPAGQRERIGVAVRLPAFVKPSAGLMYLIAHHQRNPELRHDRFRADEITRRNADDRVRLSVQFYRLAHNVRIGVEAPLPKAMAQYHHRTRSRLTIFLRQKCASQSHLSAERRKVIARNNQAEDVFVAAGDHRRFINRAGRFFAEHGRRPIPGDQPIKNLVAVAVVQVIEIRKKLVAPPAARDP